MKVVILAGGAGTRLWPVSREQYPKQLQPLLGAGTLLQQTYKRVRAVAAARDILVATTAQHAAAVAAQLPELPRANVLAEPVRRDSAGAIGLACAYIYAQDPDEIIFSVHADAWVKSTLSFVAAARSIAPALAAYPDHTLLFGIPPSYPETGYGYIQLNKKRVHTERGAVCGVSRFVEKPDAARAKRFVRDKRYYWNPGWFAWRAETLMGLYKAHLPKHYAILTRIADAPAAKRLGVIKKEFPLLPSVSIDHGILERTRKLIAIPTDIVWSDIGHWRSVSEMSRKDAAGNAVDAESVLLDCSDNFFTSQSKKLIAAIGVRNLVLVETEDVILLADKSRAQEVKILVQELSKRNKKKYV
ncbi:MAG: sugar phosphate nucleotidyltransferase [bacterium]|nr:sugar phosphate nucleotidyltransferase [bacterium]